MDILPLPSMDAVDQYNASSRLVLYSSLLTAALTEHKQAALGLGAAGLAVLHGLFRPSQAQTQAQTQKSDRQQSQHAQQEEKEMSDRLASNRQVQADNPLDAVRFEAPYRDRFGFAVSRKPRQEAEPEKVDSQEEAQRLTLKKRSLFGARAAGSEPALLAVLQKRKAEEVQRQAQDTDHINPGANLATAQAPKRGPVAVNYFKPGIAATSVLFPQKSARGRIVPPADHLLYPGGQRGTPQATRQSVFQQSGETDFEDDRTVPYRLTAV